MITLKTNIQLVLITLLFFQTTRTDAQSRFQKTMGGAILDWSNSIIQITDSNYVLLGSTKNFGSGLQDMLLVKTNRDGDTLWCKTLGLSAGDEEGATVQETSDNGFMITGTTGSAGAGGDDFILMKTDGNGTLQWAKTYGGVNVEYCCGGSQCFDGGYVIAGHTTSYGAGAADIYVVRTNSVGDTLWTRTIGNNTTDNGFGIIQSADSGFVITGSVVNSGSTDLAVVKLNSSGAIVWAKAIGGANEEIGYSLIQTADSGYCIAGQTLSFGNGNMDAYLVKLDQYGDLSWSQAFGTGDSDLFYFISPTSDGSYVMTGYVNRQGAGYDDLMLLKADNNGNIIWARSVGGSTPARDVGRSVKETFDGTFLVSGFTQSFGGGTDAFFLKTNSQGTAGCNNLSPTISAVTAPSVINSITPILKAGSIITTPAVITSGAPANINTQCFSIGLNEFNTITQEQVAVYPNPMSTTATVIANVKGNNLVLHIYDVTGKAVASFTADKFNADTETYFTVNRESMVAGIYFFNISELNIASGASLVSGKLIIQD
jgi:Secretion system C-terminal sorting domain